MPSRADILRELRTIPGVGKSIAEDFYDIGVRGIADLKGESPDALYKKICIRAGGPVDRCMLYVCRCAVYFASTKKYDPEKLKWWKWKDRRD